MATEEDLIPRSRPYLLPLLFFAYLAALPAIEASDARVAVSLGAVGANMALMAVLLLGEVVLHELGHAWVGRHFGATVDVIEVGAGPRLWHGRIGGVRWVWRLVPMTGLTRLRGPHGLFRGGRWAVISAAGPAVDLAILLLAGAAMRAADSPTSLATVVNANYVLYIVSKLSLVCNLLPVPTIAAGDGSGVTGSDGLAILRALGGKSGAATSTGRPAFDDAAVQRQANTLLESGRFADGLALVDDRLTLDPLHVGLRFYRGALLAAAGRAAEAVEVLRSVVADPEFVRFKGTGGATVKAWLAKALCGVGTDDALAEAEPVAQSAARLAWNDPFARCVLGEVLFALGRSHASIQHLEYAAHNGTEAQRAAATELLAVASPRANAASSSQEAEVEGRASGPSGNRPDDAPAFLGEMPVACVEVSGADAGTWTARMTGSDEGDAAGEAAPDHPRTR